jgi:hypothetical protein
VKIRRGPAAVTEDENRTSHCRIRWEGAASRVIRKPEDLPVPKRMQVGPRGLGAQLITEDEKRHPLTYY